MNKNSIRGKSGKLSNKIAMYLGVMLFAVFLIFIVIAVNSAQSAIKKANFGEIESLTREAGSEIQKIMNLAQTSAENMSGYMEDAYLKRKTSNVTASSSDESNRSEVFSDIILSKENKSIENFLIETSKNTLENSDDMVGIGVLFEPYAFSDKIESYSFYVSNGGKSVDVFGEYSYYSKQGYYTETLGNMGLTICDPYVDEIIGVNMISVISPIIIEGEFKGIISVDISADNFSKTAIVNENYQTIYNTIINENNLLLYHSTNPEKIGQDNSTTFYNEKNAQIASEKMHEDSAFNIKCRNADGLNVYKFYAPIQAGNYIWWANCTVEVADLMEDSVAVMILLIIIAAISLLLMIVFIVSILKKTLMPINYIVSAAQDISQGNLDINLDVNSNDEIGVLGNTFNATAAYLKMIIGDISDILYSIADNNLDVSSDSEYRGDFIKIKDSIIKITNNLNNVMFNLSQSSDQVATGADQVANGSQSLSQGAEEQAASIQELAATINQISNQINENAESAQSASSKADFVNHEVTESNKRMNSMLDAMSDISSSSQKIANIIKTIEDIAFQTNILALNAAVEAARAGAAGKGFAVVADEVRNLASKSAVASKDTAALIENSIKAVENGKKIADDTANSLNIVVDGVKSVNEIINGISKASENQAQAIGQVTLGVDQISTVIQTNSATAEESAAASEELSSQAQVLKDLVKQFKIKGNSSNNNMSSSSMLLYDDNNKYLD